MAPHIHNTLRQAHQSTGDPRLAPSTISYNAAINVWAKSYHPIAGEIFELLLGEMMHKWQRGTASLLPIWLCMLL